MRTLVIKQDTDIDALSSQLFKARLSAGQVKSALASLQAMNRHADFTKLRAGTVLIIPDSPNFKVSASESVQGGALDDFQHLARTALAQAAADVKASAAARAAERADVVAALKSAPLRRALESDAELKQQVEEAIKALKQDEQQMEEAEPLLAQVSKAAMSKLADLSKRWS